MTYNIENFKFPTSNEIRERAMYSIPIISAISADEHTFYKYPYEFYDVCKDIRVLNTTLFASQLSDQDDNIYLTVSKIKNHLDKIYARYIEDNKVSYTGYTIPEITQHQSKLEGFDLDGFDKIPVDMGEERKYDEQLDSTNRIAILGFRSVLKTYYHYYPDEFYKILADLKDLNTHLFVSKNADTLLVITNIKNLLDIICSIHKEHIKSSQVRKPDYVGYHIPENNTI